MLDHINLRNILFFDIETVPQQSTFTDMNEELQKLWAYRIHRFKPEETPQDDYFWEKAGVYAEFGKAICISVGFFTQADPATNTYQFRLKCFASHDERQLLSDFLNMLSRYFDISDKFFLCGHNIKEFDIPFICRRATILNLAIPQILDVSTARPWEVRHLDTMHLWRFGDYRNYTSLHLLTTVLEVPNPKNDLEGSQVADTYWHQNDLPRIAQYCQQDVVAVARVIQRFKQMPLLSDEQIVYVP